MKVNHVKSKNLEQSANTCLVIGVIGLFGGIGLIIGSNLVAGVSAILSGLLFIILQSVLLGLVPISKEAEYKLAEREDQDYIAKETEQKK